MSAPTTEPDTTAAAHEGFHRLRVSDVERLTDDAVAVTVAVPDDLADDFAFRAGQYLTVRLETPDAPERGAPGGARAVLRVARRPARRR